MRKAFGPGRSGRRCSCWCRSRRDPGYPYFERAGAGRLDRSRRICRQCRAQGHGRSEYGGCAVRAVRPQRFRHSAADRRDDAPGRRDGKNADCGDAGDKRRRLWQCAGGSSERHGGFDEQRCEDLHADDRAHCAGRRQTAEGGDERQRRLCRRGRSDASKADGLRLQFRRAHPRLNACRSGAMSTICGIARRSTCRDKANHAVHTPKPPSRSTK